MPSRVGAHAPSAPHHTDTVCRAFGRPRHALDGRTTAAVRSRPYIRRLAMRKVNGKHIVPISHSGVVGHVMRTHSGVKIAEFYGRDSLSRAINAALEGDDGTDVTLGEWYGSAPRGDAS
jgi:hypothetical protein